MAEILGADGSVQRKVDENSGARQTDRDAGAVAQGAGGAPVIEVDTSNFEAQVLQASMTNPVLIDFYSPRSQNSQQLTPMLETAVQQAGGAVILAKINIDESPQLAQAFRVQSVPTVMAVYQGQPVTGFQGTQPQSEIDKLVQQLAQYAGANQNQGGVDIEQALSDADAYLKQDSLSAAQSLYTQILEHDPENQQAFTGLIRTFIKAGDLDSAGEMINQAPQSMQDSESLKAVRSALELAHNADTGEIRKYSKRLKKDDEDHNARLELARAHFAQGQAQEAVDLLLEIIRRNADWEDSRARNELLKIFDALGPADPVALKGRRRLSTLVFA
jgi:putative thioredoxin